MADAGEVFAGDAHGLPDARGASSKNPAGASPDIFGGDADVIQFKDLTVENGDESEDLGGGVRIFSGNVVMSNVTVKDNRTEIYPGGGIYENANSDLTITNSTVTGNFAKSSGGGLFKQEGPDATLTVTDSQFTNNSATVGGAVDVEPPATFTNTTFTGNTASKSGCAAQRCPLDGGGAIFSYHGPVNINGGLISHNHADNSAGGGVKAGAITIMGTTISDNTALFGGGVALAFDGSTITNAIITDNGATDAGGLEALGQATVSGSAIRGNTATGQGGGVLGYGQLQIDHSEITGNTAGGDGGGVAFGGSTPSLTNTTVAGNIAARGGGIARSSAIFGSAPSLFDVQGGIPGTGTATATYVTIAANSAPQGSNIYNDGAAGVVDISRSIVATGSGSASCNLGALASNGYNVDDDTSCSFGSTGDASGADPTLGALAFNGGSTQTMALGAGSAAIDLIPPADCDATDDQRGSSRPKGAGCDSGAFEATSSATPTPTHTPTPTPTPTIEPTAAPTPTPTAAPGSFLFGDADCGGGINLGDAIGVARFLVGLTVNQADGCPPLGSSVTIDGIARIWQDITCDGSITLGDSIGVARNLVGLAVNQAAGCPQIGDSVQVVS